MAVYSLSLNFETHNLSKASTIVGRFSLIVKIIISPGCENLQHTKLFNEDDFLNSTEIHNYIARPWLEFVLVYKNQQRESSFHKALLSAHSRQVQTFLHLR